MNVITPQKEQTFNGDKKHLVHFLVPYEKKFLKAALPWVPGQVSTVHLTLMTIAWSIGVIIAGYLSQGDIRWLWMFSACILMQYVTDMLDGQVGRSRNTGLIKWGFYMDHFLDYIFLCSIVMGYSFLLPSSYFFLTLLGLTFITGFMIHTFMDFSITNNFKISCNQFGVSEMRAVLIISNLVLMVAGKGLLIQIFPFFVGASFIGLCLLVYTSQKTYRHIDAVQQAHMDGDYQ
jgi:phosphatidylglycerophosphate synthase